MSYKMQIYKILSPLVLVLFSKIVNAEYESKKYPSFSIGDVLTYTEIVKGQDNQTESTVSERLVEKETLSNSTIEKWEVIKTQTTPSLQVSRTWVWKDRNGNLLLEDFLDGDGEGFTAVYNTLDGIGEKTLNIGSQVTDKTNIGSVTMNISGYLFGGYGAERISENLSEVISLSTTLGSVSCFKLSHNQEVSAELYNANQGKFSVKNTDSGTIWYSNKYGLVKSNITANYNFTFQGETSSSSDNTTKTLISANVSNSTAN
ncbi:hypothetical protein OAQ11_02195, partial [Opitutales bacterium]|nr:hypothetical protein [Opitutales bacterium]